MPDIFHDFSIKVAPARVFEAVTTPKGLDIWWTKTSSGRPALGEGYTLKFGPSYDWRAKVTKCVADSEFEFWMFHTHKDWEGTRVGFLLRGDKTTNVSFYHTGWSMPNDHWRVSCFCWAMYLRILRRFLEHGEMVPYEKRLDA
jgi:uncharacterized protein YndB with AHSA1/START domain